MSFRVVVYCEDCTGSDEMGCFDGGTKEIGDYPTLDAAKEAGWPEVDACSPWQFRVYNEHGRDVFDSGAI